MCTICNLPQPFLTHTRLSFVTIEVSHKDYPVFVAPLQLQIQKTVAELPRWMAVPRAMSATFISAQSRLFRYSAIPLFCFPRFTVFRLSPPPSEMLTVCKDLGTRLLYNNRYFPLKCIDKYTVPLYVTKCLVSTAKVMLSFLVQKHEEDRKAAAARKRAKKKRQKEKKQLLR